MRTLLIDADTLVYNAALSAEVPIDWGDDLWTLHSDLGDACEHFTRQLEEIKVALEPTAIVMALSDSDNSGRWRRSVMPTYKNNRKKTRRPVVYGPLRAWVHETFNTYERPTLEGDDVLGILATHPSLIAGEKIIVSIDKDMRTIPGLLYNYGRDEAVVSISEEEADYNHLMQTLTGDSTDGYPGCPGIGPKRAAQVLDSAADPWVAVVRAYEKAGLNEEVALQNARVARILRASDYNFKTKEVKLWNP